MKKGKNAYGSASLSLKRFEIAALVTLLLLLVSPLFTSAQTIDELQAQIQALLARIAALQGQMAGTTTPPQPIPPGSDDYPTPTPMPSCPNLSVTMQRGARDSTTGGQVTELQVFLANHFDLDEEDVVSGYFGKQTQKYVTKFQDKYGLPAFGIVGSLTRAKIAEVCGGPTLPPPPPSCPAYMPPPCGPDEQLVGGGMLENGCIAPPRCVPSQTKCGVNSYRVENQCGASEFRNMYVKCQDGYEERQGVESSCKPASVWEEYARNVCANRCSGNSVLSVNAWLEDPTGRGKESFEFGDQLVIKWSANPVSDVELNGWGLYSEPSPMSIELRPYGNETAAGIRIVRVKPTTVFPYTYTWNVTKEGLFGDVVTPGKYYVYVNVPSKQQRGYRTGVAGPIQIIEKGDPAQPVVTITAPNGGESIPLGGAYDLRMSIGSAVPAGRTSICTYLINETRGGNFPPNPANCEMYQGGGTYVKHVVFSADSVGPLSPGKYKLSVTVDGDPIVNNTYTRLGQDESDNWFTLVPSSNAGITVTAPNGGERWEIGQLNTITWAPYGYNPDVNPAKDVNVFLERLDGSTVGQIMDTGKASLHTYFNISDYNTWAQPGQYRVYVSNRVTGATDESDAPFTLLPRAIDLKINGSDGPVTLTDNQPISASLAITGTVSSCKIYGARFSSGGSYDGAPIPIVPGTPNTYSLYAYTSPYGGSVSISANCIMSDGSSRSDSVLVNSGAVAASVRVLSPNGGESINPTKQWDIKTVITGLRTFSLALYKNDQWYAWLAKDMPASGRPDNFEWIHSQTPIVDSFPELRNDTSQVFKIYATGQRADGTGYVDDKSDAPFSFASTPLPSRISFFSVYYDNESTVDNQTKVQFGTENMKQCDLYSYTQFSYGSDGAFTQGPAVLYASGVGVGGAFGTPQSVYRLQSFPAQNGQLELRCLGSDGLQSSRIVWIHWKTSQPALGVYIGYFVYEQGQEKSFIQTQSITQADALANCQTNVVNNPGTSVRCTWNGTEIFNNTPATTKGDTGGDTQQTQGKQLMPAAGDKNANLANVLTALESVLGQLIRLISAP